MPDKTQALIDAARALIKAYGDFPEIQLEEFVALEKALAEVAPDAEPKVDEVRRPVRWLVTEIAPATVRLEHAVVALTAEEAVALAKAGKVEHSTPPELEDFSSDEGESTWHAYRCYP